MAELRKAHNEFFEANAEYTTRHEQPFTVLEEKRERWRERRKELDSAIREELATTY